MQQHADVRPWSCSLRERAEALIRIAHPDMRGELRRVIAETRRMFLAE
jgi:acyl-CoA hydrolase